MKKAEPGFEEIWYKTYPTPEFDEDSLRLCLIKENFKYRALWDLHRNEFSKEDFLGI